jgi:hypothetical protein
LTSKQFIAKLGSQPSRSGNLTKGGAAMTAPAITDDDDSDGNHHWYISEGIVNDYLRMIQRVEPNRPPPGNPERTIRKMLNKSEQLAPNIFFIDIWIFEVHGDEVTRLMICPRISQHAYKRLSERFNLNGQFVQLVVTAEINNGQQLSSAAKKRLNISKDKDAVLFKDRIYVLANKPEYRLITVLTANY